MWPVHTWLPDAHVEAPTAGSVILAGILLKMGGYGFIRFSLPMFPDASAYFAPLIYALREALVAVCEEGLEARWQRHHEQHLALAAGLDTMGLSLLPPAAERLWSLNAVVVPNGVDEAAVRKRLLAEFNIEIGAGLGPLAGRIWRVGLMGWGSTATNVLLFLTALKRVLHV